ncbi:hypothetical protein [Flavobacterium sp.]|uniref:hypothetical protein n=1 Tax=Flavobacterium sp. TaxID=239 RepID=UPI001205FBF7|nr:hypothetical protein [Flavobacterium sp.]RZJ71210.1 MAG: hypothetical protein EOO49_10695 [Flavobacterium sp.]
MKPTITAIAIFFVSLAFGQTKYEEGMKKAFALWKENKPTEASAMFERIAAAEPKQWLPNYYVALINTTASFTTKDKTQVSALLNKAQAALDVEFLKHPDNAEIMILQALTYTGWVASDPMTNAMKYSGQIMELYEKAQKSDPTNPRAVSGKAEFEIGGAKYFGSDTTPMCSELKRSLDLYANFKPENEFSPKWGKDRAEMLLSECGKK